MEEHSEHRKSTGGKPGHLPSHRLYNLIRTSKSISPEATAIQAVQEQK